MNIVSAAGCRLATKYKDFVQCSCHRSKMRFVELIESELRKRYSNFMLYYATVTIEKF
jgi:hypothetical protein